MNEIAQWRREWDMNLKNIFKQFIIILTYIII